MNKSILPKVAGSHFIMFHSWIAIALGSNEAIVVGCLDLADRGRSGLRREGKTRHEIIADLHGMIGRDAIDKALRVLVDIKWVTKTVEKLKGNSAKQFRFALNEEHFLGGADAVLRCADARTTRSEIQDCAQDDAQDGNQADSNIYKNEERKKEEPPHHGSAKVEGGGFMGLLSPHDAIEAGARVKNSAKQVGIHVISELLALWESKCLDPVSLERLRSKASQLSSSQQLSVLAIAAGKLQNARDPVAYMMTLLQKALDGSLTQGVDHSVATNPVEPVKIKFLSLSEIAAELAGKSAIWRDGELVAEVRAGGLYKDDRRFSIADASRVIQLVRSKELLLV